MGTADWVTWHDDYERPGSRLHLRLLVVQDLVARALDELPAGRIRVVSMCAGQGRDLIGVARRHRRGGDLVGRLVELEPSNAAAARAAMEQAGLAGLEVVEADAGTSEAYAGAVPADLVLACGVFGNITDADIERTVGLLPSLCAPGAWVVWTRHPSPDGIVESIVGWLADAGFRTEALVVPEDRLFGVGAARLAGRPRALEAGARFFSFVR